MNALGERLQRWLERGHAREAAGHLGAARRCYVRTVRALERNPAPDLQPLLARAWLNAGNVAPDDVSSLAAYDRAIDLLEATPSNLLGAAWLNRGSACMRLGRPEDAEDSFERASDLLAGLPDEPAVRRNRAACCMNLAAVRAVMGRVSRAEATRALELIAPLELEDAASAGVGLKARLIWLGQPEASEAWIERASDLLDSGLELGRSWLRRGRPELQATTSSLFQLGAKFHVRHLPRFLAEYLREHLWESEEFLDHCAGNERATELRQSLQDRLLTGPAGADTVQVVQELAQLLEDLADRQAEVFATRPEGAWLRARAHELSGWPQGAREEWRRHLQQHPPDDRLRAALESWPEHRGDEAAARRFLTAAAGGCRRAD